MTTPPSLTMATNEASSSATPLPETTGVPGVPVAGAPPTDPRVSFDQVHGKWIYEPLAGSDDPTLEWDDATQQWIPQSEESTAPPEDENLPSNKRKRITQERAANKKAKPDKSRPVSSVFITGLPDDVTVTELADVFGKYGVLLEDEPGKPRVKLYHDDQGKFKGEALITYFKPDSVELAITVLDQSPLRVGATKPLMNVERATFKEPPSAAPGAEGTSTQVQPPKQRSEEEKKRIKDRNKRLNEKLNDWDSDEERVADPTGEASAAVPAAEAGGRTVILKHMFTIEELDAEPALLLDLKTDVREECENITAVGAVTNVVLYDKEPEGIISVRFSTPEAAQICVDKMHGRWFDKRKVEAYITTAVRPKFARSGVRDADDEAVAEEEQARTEAFGKWLETHEDE